MSKRKFNSSYIQFVFTSIIDGREEKGQCVLCNKVLGQHSLRPSKLKLHLEKVHPGYKDKDLNFFERKEECLKRQRLDARGDFQQHSKSLVEASYVVSFMIAKECKPYTIGETLIKPCATEMARIVLGPESEKKLKQIPLSNDTVNRRIAKLSANIKEQVISELKNSPFGMFSIQLDETTDVASCSQLLVFCRYFTESDMKDNMLFCSALESTTKAVDVMQTLAKFFDQEELKWENLCGVCTDGAPAMLGARSGLQTLVRNRSPDAVSMHCMIHRQALASKTLPESLQDALNIAIKTVNFIKNGALNTRLFRNLCSEMNAEHQNLLYYTRVRWLSKGNVLARVFELREELQEFLNREGKYELESFFKDKTFVLHLSYLVDIFGQLNRLNLKMQRKDTTVLDFMDVLNAFVEKLDNWQRKVEKGNFAMFETLSSVVDGNLDRNLSSEIIAHLANLKTEFLRYFPEISNVDLELVKKPFSIPVEKIQDDLQDELIDLRNDSACKDMFDNLSICEFWARVCASYPSVAKVCMKVLLPFSSTYLCESGFSTLLNMKTKARNRLDAEDGMRCALSSTSPRIEALVDKFQQQISH